MSTTDANEHAKAISAIRAQMAKVAFSGLDQVNARAALVMARHGIIRSYDTATPSEAAVALVQEVIAGSTEGLLFGPLIAVDNKAIRHRDIDFPVFWFLNKNVTIRRLAFDFFSFLSMEPSISVGPRLRAALKKQSQPLVANGIREWGAAALNLFDAVQADWHIALAGLKQSLDWSFVDGANELLPLILRPSVGSALDAAEAMAVGRKQINDIYDFVTTVVDDSLSLEALVDAFMSAAGHLPLSGEVSLGAAIERFCRTHPDQSPWSALWEQARYRKDPFAQYHLCIAFLWHPEWCPENGITELTSALNRILAISGDEGLNNSDPEWTLRELLSGHYLRMLECNAPEFVDDTLASLALFMASRVAPCLEQASEGKLSAVDDIARPETIASEHLWRVVRPPGSQTPLRRAALLTPSLWALSAASEIASRKQSVLMPDASFELVGYDRVITRSVLSLFPFTIRTEDRPIYAFQRLNGRSLSNWSKDAHSEATKAVPSLLDFIGELVRPEKLRDRLRDFFSLPESEQVMACLAIQMLSPVEPDVRDIFWNTLQDETWRCRFFKAAHPKCVDMVGEALIELQHVDRVKWLPAASHFFASVLENAELDDERKSLLTAMAMVASVSGGTTSAIARLQMNTDEALQLHVNAWSEKLRRMMNVPSPVAVARIRRCLAAFG